MSLRHFKSTITASCLVVAAAVSTASATVFQTGLTSPEMLQPSASESEVAIRSSGRISDSAPVAYRASGRFHGGFDRNMLAYRASERGVEMLAYRASGRFGGGFWGSSLLSEILEQGEETIAYRASGRFHGGFERYTISYRGSERGIDTLV